MSSLPRGAAGCCRRGPTAPRQVDVVAMAGTVERGGATGAGAGPDPAGEVKLEEFGALLERAFATYGLSVVTDRALPDARDGLKPVQRRILYCMWVARFLSTRPTVKSAEVVGQGAG